MWATERKLYRRVFLHPTSFGGASWVVSGVSGLITGKAVRTVVDLSTTGVPTTIELSGALAQHDVLLIDAPVSGGVAGARDERLALMVACPTPVFAEIDTHWSQPP